MSPFVETIRIKDGKAMLLPYHLERLNRTRKHFWPNAKELTINDLLIDVPFQEGLQKARIVYGMNGIDERTFNPYIIREINTLKIVEDNQIDYTWKSTDRNTLQNLKDRAEGCDEIIIIKNGLVTDTSYTNLCFYDGQNWYTPQNPLLKGIMRQHLLDRGIIRERKIMATDIKSYQKIALINAMIKLGDITLLINNTMTP